MSHPLWGHNAFSEPFHHHHSWTSSCNLNLTSGPKKTFIFCLEKGEILYEIVQECPKKLYAHMHMLKCGYNTLIIGLHKRASAYSDTAQILCNCRNCTHMCVHIGFIWFPWLSQPQPVLYCVLYMHTHTHTHRSQRSFAAAGASGCAKNWKTVVLEMKEGA